MRANPNRSFLAVNLIFWALAVGLCPLGLTAAPSGEVIRDWMDQYARIEQQLAGGIRKQPAAAEMLEPNALLLGTDRDPLDVAVRRTRALLAHLKATAAAKDWDHAELELDEIARRGAACAPGSAERASLYQNVRSIGREAAFANPLLDFDAILFAERKCVGEDNFSGGHMTTASFGHTQLYGSGLYIARNIKSDSPLIVEKRMGRCINCRITLSSSFAFSMSMIVSPRPRICFVIQSPF